MSRRVGFAVLALAFVATSLFHLVKAFLPAPTDDPSYAPRHALFVLINLLCAVGVTKRPRWFALPFAVLLVQQLASHGSQLVDHWRAHGVPSLDDLAVVVFMPLVFGLLIWDALTREAPTEGPG